MSGLEGTDITSFKCMLVGLFYLFLLDSELFFRHILFEFVLFSDFILFY